MRAVNLAPPIVGAAAGLVVGLINRGDDGPVGLQDREVSESLVRTGITAGAFGVYGALLGHRTVGLSPAAGAASFLLGGALLGASYQFVKNSLD